MSERISFAPADPDRDIEVTVTVVMKESVLREARERSRLAQTIGDQFAARIGNSSGPSVYDAFEESL